MKKARYVVGFMYDNTRAAVVLVRKKRPDWQRGKLNGVGGKVEPGESYHDAMAREWREETGDKIAAHWEQFCALGIKGATEWAEVRFYRAIAHSRLIPYLRRQNDVREELVAMQVHEAVLRSDVLPNLKWLLPLAFNDPAKPFVTAREQGE